MGDWNPFELPDGSYADDTRPFSQQDVVNYLPTFAEAQGTRSRAKYKTVPGLAHFTHVGDGPHRGARDVEGKAFIVSGRKLYQVAVDGTATEIGTIPGTGRVSMTHNQIAGGNQLIMATGDNSYVYDTVTETLAATGVALVCVDFLNQRILGVDQARRFWRYSGVATATSWEELDNESAESSPDRIVGGIVSQGEWLVFGERTIEVFSNSPNEATAFVRSQVIEKGCANANTICRLDNSVMWVGNDGVPYRLNGYTPVPIASKAIIDTISSGNPRKLSAFTWEDKGYVCYYVTAQDGYTFGYDVTSGKWHRRESYGFDRWRINTLFKWNNAWYAGDFQNGRMYRLQWGYVYEGCEIMPRKIRTGVLHNNGNRVTVHGFRLDVATGGPASEPNCPEYVPPVIEPTNIFMSFGRAGAGFRGVSRPLDSEIEWVFASDADVYNTDSTDPNGFAVYGSRVFSATLGGECAFAELSALDTWATGPTGLPSILLGGAMAAVGTRLWYAASTSGMKYLTDQSDAAFQTVATFSGANMTDVVGVGTAVVVASKSAKIYVATGGGTTFSLVNDLYLPAGMEIDAGRMAASDTRLLVAGHRYVPTVEYSDNLGGTFTPGTFPATAGAPLCARYCGGTRWLVGGGLGSSTTGLYMSTDNGANFAGVTLPESISINEFGIAIDGTTGRCVVYGATVGSSPRAYWTDDYATWHVLSLAGTATGSTVFPLYPNGS